jgi:hypothetical protein
VDREHSRSPEQGTANTVKKDREIRDGVAVHPLAIKPQGMLTDVVSVIIGEVQIAVQKKASKRGIVLDPVVAPDTGTGKND